MAKKSSVKSPVLRNAKHLRSLIQGQDSKIAKEMLEFAELVTDFARSVIERTEAELLEPGTAEEIERKVEREKARLRRLMSEIGRLSAAEILDEQERLHPKKAYYPSVRAALDM